MPIYLLAGRYYLYARVLMLPMWYAVAALLPVATADVGLLTAVAPGVIQLTFLLRAFDMIRPPLAYLQVHCVSQHKEN